MLPVLPPVLPLTAPVNLASSSSCLLGSRLCSSSIGPGMTTKAQYSETLILSPIIVLYRIRAEHTAVGKKRIKIPKRNKNERRKIHKPTVSGMGWGKIRRRIKIENAFHSTGKEAALQKTCLQYICWKLQQLSDTVSTNRKHGGHFTPREMGWEQTALAWVCQHKNCQLAHLQYCFFKS